MGIYKHARLLDAHPSRRTRLMWHTPDERWTSDANSGRLCLAYPVGVLLGVEGLGPALVCDTHAQMADDRRWEAGGGQVNDGRD